MGSCAVNPDQLLQFLKIYYLSSTKNKKLLKSKLEDEALAPLQVDIQEKILYSTVWNPISLKYPPSISYQKFFLRTLIEAVELYGSEIHCILVEKYTSILSNPVDEKFSYCSYIIDDKCTISLQEDPCFVAKSTTGLQTWEASKYLCDWCAENTSYFKNKKILELGSGVGLLGLTVLKLCCPSAYIFSDKSWEVLKVLSTNIAINCEERVKNSIIQKLQLVWATVSKEDAVSLAPDIILGADLAYDPAMIESLVYALKILLTPTSSCAYIANGIRSLDTNQKFISALESHGLAFDVMKAPENSSFIFSESASFILYKIENSRLINVSIS